MLRGAERKSWTYRKKHPKKIEKSCDSIKVEVERKKKTVVFSFHFLVKSFQRFPFL